VAAPDQVAARDAVIGWYRGEFAAANAVIDALCGHLAQIGGAAEYEAVYAALHRRRLNWFPVLHMQKFYSINDVASELRRVADAAHAAAAAHAAYSEEEAASTVIQEPMDDLVTVAADPVPVPAPVPEHVHEPVPPQEDPPAATEEAQPEEAVPVDADHELDGEDSSGDSSERKAASTEDDAVPDDGRKYNHPPVN
jgi:alkylated DNA repair protein alkB family protein 5